jgi:rubrerythrin
MSLFKISEFIEMAARDEDTGEALYKALSNAARTEKFKTAFSAIAEQESKHAKTFRAMLNDANDKKIREEYAGQYETYLKALLETRAFTTPDKAVAAAKNYESDTEAVSAALRMEKDTLLFYTEMLEFLPTSHKDTLEKIVDEEKQHIKDLTVLIV